MPKIIPDLRNKIIQTAGKLFESQGFEKTDVKSIAAGTGIGVGTLYNYFHDKTEIFWEVMTLWRSELSRELSGIFDGPGDPKNKFTILMERLLTNAEQYSGLWKEFLIARPQEVLKKMDWAKHGSFSSEEGKLTKKIQDVLREAWKGNPFAAPLLDDPESKLTNMIIMGIFHIVLKHPDKQEQNRIYLQKFIDFLFSSTTPREETGQ